jgi:hypothetical protein
MSRFDDKQDRCCQDSLDRMPDGALTTALAVVGVALFVGAATLDRLIQTITGRPRDVDLPGL